MGNQTTTCIVLAAGKGTRMKSEKAKVLHEVFYAPMIHHVLDALDKISVGQTLVVVGHQVERVKEALIKYEVSFVRQAEQLGTGHAVLCAEEKVDKKTNTVMILCGDTPLISAATLENMLLEHYASQSVLTIMTTILENPSNYGRIACNEQGHVLRIVEEKDATVEQKRIKEINAGIYCADVSFLFDALKKVGSDNSQGEIYLTDIVELAIQAGHSVNRFAGVDAEEVLGVNSRLELAAAHSYLQMERNKEFMLSGVSLFSPETISIQKKVSIDKDTCIYANVQISGKSTIGAGCTIHPNSMIHSCRIGNNVTIGPFCNLDNQVIADSAIIKPNIVAG